MTSQVVQGTWLKEGGYGRFRGQCVNTCLFLPLVKVPIQESVKGPLQYLLRPLLGKNEFAVTQHMQAYTGPNLDNIHLEEVWFSS